MKWISASDLERWGRTRASATDLPGMVSDLIRATAEDITAIRFPSGEKGQIRGFDGNLLSSGEHLNVPDGKSIWEFGTDVDYKGKIRGDFYKRTQEVSIDEQRDTSIVLVTPFSWDSSKSSDKIEDEERKLKEKSSWKKVTIIDGISLEHWLEANPAVAAWHAKNTIRSKPQIDILSTDEFWDNFSNRFSPQLREEVVLCERETASEQLVNALLGPPQITSIIADSPDEVIAFAVASIRKAKPEVRLFLEAKTLIVDSMIAGRQLFNSTGLIYILRNDAARVPGQFNNYGPVLLPLGRQQRNGSGIVLERPSAFSMAKAMSTMGISEEEALTLARGCGRSLAALARQKPGGMYEDPPWKPDCEIILPAILAGAWDASNPHDTDIIAKLAKSESYYSYEGSLRKYPDTFDPPLDREGTVWKVRAPMDAFIHAGVLIGPDHLKNLMPILKEVFGKIEVEDDPSESIRISAKKAQRHSSWLRDGLATTVLLIAVWEKNARLSIALGAGQQFANELMRSLPGLGTDPRLLRSLEDELPLLAEAAPVPLLSALESMLEGYKDQVRSLLQESEGAVFPTAHHVGLLWALERLAWDPTYFRRATLILAAMAELDPGGRVANRPAESLAEIFLLWDPSTNADTTLQKAVLDELVAKYPGVAWALVLRLLPGSRDISSPTSKPILREEGAASRDVVSYADLWIAQRETVQRAIHLASGNTERWLNLLTHLSNMSEADRTVALLDLDETLSLVTAADQQLLCHNVRKLIDKHRRFSEAQWALKDHDLAKFQEIVDKYSPDETAQEIVELFSSWSSHAVEDEKSTRVRRVNIVRRILADSGPSGILDTFQKVEIPYLLIQAIDSAKIEVDVIESIFLDALHRDPPPPYLSMLSGLYRRSAGMPVAEKTLSVEHAKIDNDDLFAQLLTAWPSVRSTWHVARRMGHGVERAYWAKKGPIQVEGGRFLLFATILQYLKYNRGRSALSVLLGRVDEVPSRLLLKVLDQTFLEITSSGSGYDSMLSYELEKVFSELDSRTDVTETEVVGYEFRFFPVLENSERPLRIHNRMAHDPQFYHQLLCEVYKGDAEEKKDSTEVERSRWKRAYRLLSSLRVVPGFETSIPNAVNLSRWIDEVQRLGRENHRSVVSDLSIGHILAHAPPDDDGAWPHRFVRDEIERAKSSDVERGIYTERFNMRGVYMKEVLEGGEQERDLAKMYHEFAGKCVDWPRTSEMLKAMASRWAVDAEEEDVEARKRLLRS